MNRYFLLLCLCALIFSCGDSKDPVIEENVTIKTVSSTEDSSPYKDDVQSIQLICYAYQEVLSGSAGDARNWDRLRYLCLPQTQLNQVFHADYDELNNYTVESYIEQDGGWYDNVDLDLSQLGITIDRFGNMAQVFQTYESVWDDQQGDSGREIGINAYMLVYQNERWYIANVLWDTETDSVKVDPIYLEEDVVPTILE
ncbi:MAG: hypothetical protein HRT72_13515 [Flavobacteriales bacterium]|nr:hypothetical protein [Flavobacteriales bacterium]